MSTLTLRKVAIDTYRENVAYLHRDCKLYRSEGFQALNKIEIHSLDGAVSIIAVLNVVDDDCITKPDELGLCEQAFRQMGGEAGVAVNIAHARLPASLKAVHRKISGDNLGLEDYQGIARDIASNRYSKIEMAAFLVACSQTGLERDEVLYLTKAMIETGKRLNWGEPLVVDKHCIGGIPGNRTTMLIVPIVAAHGMLIPKTSSRAITSPAGTADTMEVLARVELSPHELHEIVRAQRACLAWGGTAELAPVDDILIAVERPLSMDSPGQMVASILSKKLAAGATHLIIDIPIGATAKISNRSRALALRRLFEYVGDHLGLSIEVVLTDGRQPVGRGIGPALESRDVMQVLNNDPAAPLDLREKSLQLAGRIIEFDPDVRGGQGYVIARDILESGRALAKMQAIVDAQGRNPNPPQIGHFCHDVTATDSGQVTSIDNLQLAHIARLAGAPMDKGAGVDLHKKLGDPVEVGETLFSIYAEFPADFEFARESAEQNSGFTTGNAVVDESP
ncbi:putative thymidine phosphorylase [Luminiphilus syltensis NOR5-1B]|uniref:Putative thymidine phosphorylase n=1 Tax=Luminiphilus syltensis NOR5-1B TaxID=565045 RepID=B8KX97_9GAMM|nr:thymidine phosphorylase family protein [Luminiphilus syltensis]EED36823.1 putative thymidine phosphorylase [Luminiphilus syltensis NOR5-1B]